MDSSFCKKKNKCKQKHPPQDCNGECDDLNTSTNRYRIECKNGISCVFLQYDSCEFLHPETWEQELQPNSEIDTLKIIHEGYGMRITDIEEKLSILERITMESTKNIKYLETKFFDKIEILEVKLLELQNKTVVEIKTGEISNE